MRSRWPSSHPLWSPMHQLQGELNRLFDRYATGEPSSANYTTFPALNVWEEGEHLVVEAELPGLDLNDVEIYVTGGNQLTIKGARKPAAQENGVWHRREREFGAFTRTLTLPYPVDADKVDARLEHGVLLLCLAKHESARPRRISVKGE
jgi:HSP20 family protein